MLPSRVAIGRALRQFFDRAMSPSLSHSTRQQQRGLTLVELMVAVAINLVVVLVAAYLYLNGRNTQQAVEERSAVFENGQLALELLGKEIGNAGYYPAQMREPSAMAVNRGRYVNPQPGVAAFNAGVFGCVNGHFNFVDGFCTKADDKEYTGDGLVLNYFTEDALALSAGARGDCLGFHVDKDPLNASRLGAAKGHDNQPPGNPLFVSNRYTLKQYDYSMTGGRKLSTFGLVCQGNGSAAPSYQPLVPGIEQLRLLYGLRDAGAARATQYVDATAVNTAASIVVNEMTLQGWARVVSVQVCVVARSLSETRFRGAGAETRVDCDGNTLLNDGVQRRRFMQVFAVKNSLS